MKKAISYVAVHLNKENLEMTNINGGDLLDLKKNDIDCSMDFFLYAFTTSATATATKNRQALTY